MYNRDPLFATLDHKGYCKQEFLNKLYDNKKVLGSGMNTRKHLIEFLFQ